MGLKQLSIPPTGVDADHRRVQRREFKDYQPLFMLIHSLDIIDDATRREFMCISGPVWLRYNEATKGASQRRITALFLSNEHNGFEELLFVGCDFVRRRERRCRALWDRHALCADLGDDLARYACIELSGRSVLKLSRLMTGEGAEHLAWPAGRPALAMPASAA